MTSASSAIPQYLDTIRIANKSGNTRRTYTHALRLFSRILGKNDELSEHNFIKFLKKTGDPSSPFYVSPASQHTYRAAVARLYAYHAPGVPVKLLTDQYAQKLRKSFIKYNESGVEKLIEYAEKGLARPGDLLALRDRAFILALADTGLRISEACSLKRGDIDFANARALISGKGDKPGVIRFSKRSLEAIRLYLSARSDIDGKSGRPLASLPVFARHDRGAGKKIKPISYKSMDRVFEDRVKEAGITEEEIEEAGPVTAHKLRHRFVTKILRETGNPAKAQILARHEDINMTMRYGHLAETEIDEDYREIFDQ